MIKDLLRQKLEAKFPGVGFDILVPPNDKMGDYSTNVAFVTAETQKQKKAEATEKKKNLIRGNAEGTESAEMVAQKIVKELKQDKELLDVFEKIEAVKPGFVNFFLKDDFLRKKLSEIIGDKN